MDPSPTYGSEDCHAVHERAGEGPYPDTGEGASVSLSQHTICSLWILYIYSPDKVDQLFLITEKNMWSYLCSQVYFLGNLEDSLSDDSVRLASPGVPVEDVVPGSQAPQVPGAQLSGRERK